jgi:hypothetical protein
MGNVTRTFNTGGPPRLSAPAAPPGGAGMPALPAIAWATVGLEPDPDDPTPDATIAFWFIRGNQAYVECTLQPSGGTVVARVNMDGGYEVLAFGDRVVLACANGDPNSSVIIGKLHDDGDPLPEKLAGDSIPVAGPEFDPSTKAKFASRVQFIRSTADTVLVLETTGAGDLVLHSAAGLSIRAPGGYVMVDGQHIILGASPEVATVPGMVVGEEATPGVPFLPPQSDIGTTDTIPPYEGYLDGLVRARDKFQVNSTNDPEPFLYWQALHVIVNAILTVPEVLVAIAPAIVVWQALGLSPPTKLTSEAMSASQRVEAR